MAIWTWTVLLWISAPNSPGKRLDPLPTPTPPQTSNAQIEVASFEKGLP